MAITENYGLFMPTEDDSMADVVSFLNDNWDKLRDRADPTVIAAGVALPQAGDYELGDRVFRADAATGGAYPSVYILVCKDANYGWHWRPVQHNISPWVTLPVDIVNDANFEVHLTYPVQVAFDSKGWCHWRGALRRTTPNIPEATSYTVLKNIPAGLRPTTRLMHTVPVSPAISATSEEGYVGGRYYMDETGSSTFRFFNTNNPSSQNFWLTGLKYQPSLDFYYNA